MKILITNARAPGGLELARLLYKSGHEVFIAESMKYHLCLNSRAVKRYYQTSSPRINQTSYINEINQIIEKENIDTLIPCFEEAFYISLHKDKINCNSIFVEDINKLKVLHNKYEFINLCEEFGLDVPKSYFIDHQNKFDKLNIDSKDFVFKPVFSRYGEEVLISPKRFKFKSGEWVCQERLRGRSFCTYSVCVDGNVNSLSIYPVNIVFGKVCTSFTQLDSGTEDYKKIKEWIISFVEKSNYTGQIGFDFIVSDKARAIECNPRMTSGIHLFNDNKDFVSSFFKKTKMIEPSAGKTRNMTLVMLFGVKQLFSAFRNIIIGSDVAFDKKDKWPFINQFIVFGYLIYLSFRSGMTISKVSSYDIEWNGEI